ncbi:MAG: ABC transporter substrate-binding protein [Burkholderiales bacterium]|nr:MAG: ABC transporter substrate-binding protein [Burkholderiales bacterium]
MPIPTPVLRSVPPSATTRRRLAGATVALLAGLALPAAPVAAQDKVVFATNWKAQAAHGGFYQALADGTYKRLGLDVEIRQGGPQVNNRPLLPAGRIDFLMTGNLLHTFDNVRNGVPTVVVAAMFQKDPQVLLAHPGQYETWNDLKKAPVILVAKDGQFSFWQWMKQDGFRDEQLRPYTYNSAPFLANRRSVQQGYAVAEPISIEKAAGFAPRLFLLADHGWSTYSTTIETRPDLVKTRPDLVRRFVEGSILGWVNYLHGQRAAADALIRKENPEVTQEELDQGVAKLKALGIVDSGDARTLGIGAIDPARVKDFHDKMVRAGLFKAGEVDLSRVYTTEFVNKAVGVDVRRALTGSAN